MSSANRATTPPVSARRQATRTRLLAAASEVLAERGFHGASVEDICERAGFTRGAFYSNFSGKDELVTELYADHARELRDAIAEVAAEPGLTLPALLDRVVDVWAGDADERRRWYLLTTEFALHALRDEGARRRWVALQSGLRAELAELIDDIATRHGLHVALPTDHVVRLVTIVLQGGLGQHLLEPRSVPVGRLERELLPALVAGATD